MARVEELCEATSGESAAQGKRYRGSNSRRTLLLADHLHLKTIFSMCRLPVVALSWFITTDKFEGQPEFKLRLQ